MSHNNIITFLITARKNRNVATYCANHFYMQKIQQFNLQSSVWYFVFIYRPGDYGSRSIKHIPQTNLPLKNLQKIHIQQEGLNFSDANDAQFF